MPFYFPAGDYKPTKAVVERAIFLTYVVNQVPFIYILCFFFIAVY